jgi:drug/metabolite transporter (DMT)-like permease
MSWLTIAIIGYFFLALANVGDKLLISRAIQPVVYTFFTCLLGLLIFVLAPWGLTWPGFYQLLICLATGIVFFIALFLLFKAISIAEVSRVVTIVGGLTPLFVFVFSYFFLKERLVSSEITAFLVLMAGIILVSIKKEKTFIFPKKVILMALFSAFFYAGFYSLSKYIYFKQSFISGFIWTRVGAFLGALIFLTRSGWRQAIIKAVSGQTQAIPPHQYIGGGGISTKIKLLFLSNQTIGALGFVLTNYAIALASVTLVNAMQGVQYAFVLILTIFIVKKSPQLLKEKITGRILVQKILAICLIGLGLVLLYLTNG